MEIDSDNLSFLTRPSEKEHGAEGKVTTDLANNPIFAYL